MTLQNKNRLKRRSIMKNIRLKRRSRVMIALLIRVRPLDQEEIIDKKRLNKIKLKNEDKIEIVHFIGGG